MKIEARNLVILGALVFLSSLVVASTTFYVLNQNFEKERATFETELRGVGIVKKKVSPTSSTASTDITDSWKTFQGVGFSIKYPSNWVYKDYSKLPSFGAFMVGFADSTGRLAPEQSDGFSVVDINWDSENLSNVTTNPAEKLVKETVKVNNYDAIKMTLLPGRLNEMGGDFKIVRYQITLSNGKTLVATNTNDVEKTIFEKMIQTIK